MNFKLNTTKIVGLNIVFFVLNMLFFTIIQPQVTIFQSIFSSLAILFLEDLIILGMTVVLFISRKEIVLTHTNKQRDILNIFNLFTFNDKLDYEFIPSTRELAQVKPIFELFSETDKVETLASKYLKDFVLLDTEQYMLDLQKLSTNSEFVRESAIMDSSYTQDNFEQSRYKLEVYQGNYDKKMGIFLENSSFDIKINFKELAKNYPNYNREMTNIYMENKDLLDSLSRKPLKYNSEFKEFFNLIFTNFNNDKKEQGYVLFKNIVEELSKSSIQSVDEFNTNIQAIKDSI